MTPIRSTAYALRSLALALAVLALAAPAGAGVHTFFQGTQYPLKVHFLKGEEPGPTVMVQGGIQGDEISGFLTAQLLTGSRIKRGNLIVVPRANVPSINAGRRFVNVDLNRRFDREYNDFYEDRLARVIRHLLARSQAFIHLHEGSGFYHPTWVDAQRNPKRYGQSVIIDTLVYENEINLAGSVSSVLDALNPTVVPADYRFRLFNTDTFAEGSAYAEQRKSLTCYALSNHRIPALAIEVSKSIRHLDWKVREQLKAAAMFLESFGVVIEPPGLDDDAATRTLSRRPEVFVNGRALPEGGRLALELSPYEDVRVRVKGGETLFEPVAAVFASDRDHFDLSRSPRLAAAPFETLEVRSDGRKVGAVDVSWKGQWPRASADRPLFLCWLNGKLTFVPENRTLEAVAGDQLIIEGLWGGGADEIVNIKGLVTSAGRNDGQDAGTEVILDPGQFIARYFVEHADDGTSVCRVVRETENEERAEFRIRIRPRTLSAVKLTDARGQEILVPWTPSGSFRLAPGRYTLADAWSNGGRDKLLALVDGEPVAWGESFLLDFNGRETLEIRQATTFEPIGAMRLSAASMAARPSPPSAF